MQVSSIQVRALLEALHDAGVSSDDFLLRAEIAAGRVADVNGWFSEEEFDRLMMLALTVTADPAFGLRWGERSPMMQYDLLTPLVAQAPSLRVSIENILRFQSILAERDEVTFGERNDTGVLSCNPLGVQEAVLRMRGETVVTSLLRMLRYLGVLADQSCLRVTFPYERPAHGAEYDRIFGERAHFGERSFSIVFPRAWLDHPASNRNAELHRLLEEQAEHWRARMLNQLPVTRQLARHLGAAPPGSIEMPRAARALGLSERSLRRKLAAEGTSYAELVDNTRVERARQLLAEGKPIKLVAAQVGFASVNAFHRAFKRWTGSSPGKHAGR